MFWSGPRDRLITSPVWPLKDWASLPDSMSNRALKEREKERERERERERGRERDVDKLFSKPSKVMPSDKISTIIFKSYTNKNVE